MMLVLTCPEDKLARERGRDGNGSINATDIEDTEDTRNCKIRMEQSFHFMDHPSLIQRLPSPSGSIMPVLARTARLRDAVAFSSP